MERQYIGARYVPKFYEGSNENNWESGVEYEALTIVTYNNATYTSKIPVPNTIGNPLDNPRYWIKTADYNAQIDELTRIVNEKTSDEYIGNIVAEEIGDTGINTWFADNESDNTASYSPSLIPFNMFMKKQMNLNTRLKIADFNTCDTITEQKRVNSTDIEEDYDVIMLEGGYKAKKSTSGNANCNINNVLPIKNNASYYFKTDLLESENTDYGKVGLIFGTEIKIYHNNDTKTFYYEDETNTPTQLSAVEFDTGTIEVMCCVYGEGNGVKVFAKTNNDKWEHLGDATCETSITGKKVSTFVRTGNCEEYFSIYDIKSFYTFKSIADTRYIHYDDTTPMILNNKAYLTATLKISDGISYTGILRHTLGYDDFELVGIIKITDQYISMGTELVFDRKEKRFIGLFRHYVGNDLVQIYKAFSKNNNLNGELFFDVSVLNGVVSDTHEFGTMNGDEDPACCKFDGHWYVAINRAPNGSHSYFYYDVFRSVGEEFNENEFEYWCTFDGNLTGGVFIAIGNKLYLVCGNGSNLTSFDIINKNIDGNLGVTVDNRVWGNITGVIRGNKVKYYITTFTRNKYTDNAEDLWSYGDIVMYESTDTYGQDGINNTYGLK